jgi:hypothetical protein
MDRSKVIEVHAATFSTRQPAQGSAGQQSMGVGVPLQRPTTCRYTVDVSEHGATSNAGHGRTAVRVVCAQTCACMLNVQASMQSFTRILIAPVDWSKTEDPGRDSSL